MNAESIAVRPHPENWLPILELSVQEVFEIMLSCRVEPATEEAPKSYEFTAMVGLAGALCGILTICCGEEAAKQIANRMLGSEGANSESQVWDALGELCNMIAGNFESGSAQMKAGSQPAFDRIATLLRQRNCRLRIEGHTDSTPIHNGQFSSNWELSTARATEIVRILIVRDGFNAAQLSAAGYAEYHPIATNQTVEGRAMNRRVDIVILKQETPALATPAAATSPPAGRLQKPSPVVVRPASYNANSK